ncbi:MAG: 3-keto-5-aminohexanoate cleavage protein [Myxococcales bacterium]|nr:3-keto-5-aminohexanoate cleavage protein [Myxococcales bacterium]
MSDTDKVIVTCAMNGVLTDPNQHPVPVTPEQMAQQAREAHDAGAAVVHIHFRRQEPGMGRMPSWDPDVAAAICDAIRAEVPELLINMTTGVVGRDVSGPKACLERVRPEIAAMNSGSLNYLRTRRDGRWAWPPMLFDNPVDKIEEMLEAMRGLDVVPECECFDTGIVRSLSMFERNGMLKAPYTVSFVMGVASGMPARADLLPILVDEAPEGCSGWQAIVIGRQSVWPVHRRCAELGGHLRTGLEDTFYLPSGEKVSGNGPLIEAIVGMAREVGREPATPAEVRELLAGG